AAKLVPATGLAVRDLMAAIAGAAVEAALGRAVVPVAAPGLREQRVDRLRREDADSVKRAAIQQHPADAREVSRRDAQSALRREQSAVFAGPPQAKVAWRALFQVDRTGRPNGV